MRVLLFEDQGAEKFSPLALTRPVFELVCGRESLRRRLQRWFPDAELGAWIRPWLADVYAEDQPSIHVNEPNWLAQGPVLLVNGRWLPDRRLTPLDFVTHQAGLLEGNPAWVLLTAEEAASVAAVDPAIAAWQLAATRPILPTTGSWLEYPWDLVSNNARQLVRDFEDEGVSQKPELEHVQVLGDPSDVYVSAQALIDPYVVIDTRTGPVSIDRDAKIQSFTRIEGPCHIGRGTQIFRALIRGGTTIGEHCRVGGEVEESVLHGFVNKYHEGFLGHSYVCPWVNLGAMSCTSDLKNDYSSVKVPLQGALVETGLQKVGTFFGDHSKAALDSMFNTGSSIGVMAMALTGGRLLPRHIPSFSTVMYGEPGPHATLDASIETARLVMTRRGQTLTDKGERLLRLLYLRTEHERQTALRRYAERTPKP